MHDLRIVDAYCDSCGEARRHEVTAEDPGSCRCTVCGHVQLNYEPVEA